MKNKLTIKEWQRYEEFERGWHFSLADKLVGLQGAATNEEEEIEDE